MQEPTSERCPDRGHRPRLNTRGQSEAPQIAELRPSSVRSEVTGLIAELWETRCRCRPGSGQPLKTSAVNHVTGVFHCQ